VTAHIVDTEVFRAEVVVVAILVAGAAAGNGDGLTCTKYAGVVGTWVAIFTVSGVLTTALDGHILTGP